MGAVLEAAGLRERFEKVQAVDGVSLSIEPGDRVALLGPNGSGKTTTLIVLLGAVTPDAGTGELLGHRLPRRARGGHAGDRLRRRLPAAAGAAEGDRGRGAVRPPPRP